MDAGQEGGQVEYEKWANFRTYVFKIVSRMSTKLHHLVSFLLIISDL